MRLAQIQKKKIKEDGQASFHLIAVREVDHLEDDTESAEALEISEIAEGFQHSLANGKLLKNHFP